MSGNLADLQGRQTRQRDPLNGRAGILPDRRETRVPGFEGFARMGSASRGDVGGAEELRRTLGLATKAAGDFQEYTVNRFERAEEENAARAGIDQASGRIDTDRMRESFAYRSAVELGREQAALPQAVQGFGDRLSTLLDRQTDANPDVRKQHADEAIEDFFQSYARDPETGDLRAGLTTPGAMRWLREAIMDNRNRLRTAAHASINERLGNEALTNVSEVARTQLDAGGLSIAALRQMLPPTVSDDQLRGTLLITIQGRAEELKSDGRFDQAEQAVRILDQLLTPAPTGVRLVDIPASTPVPFGSAAPAPARTPSAAKRRTREEVIGFVLNTLEGGAQVVDNRDGGGTTKFGITKRNNPDVDVANLTFGQAKGIAQRRYWQAAYDAANPAVAAIAFDAGFINSKAFGREIATKYANDPQGALAAYRSRLQSIAKKPDKARFLQPWMNRVDRLASYLGVGSEPTNGDAADDLINDPSFALNPEPLDPVEAARRNPGVSFADQFTGGLALRPEDRTKLIEFRDQFTREVKVEWQRKRAEQQDEAGQSFLLRLSGLGPSVTPTEIAEAARRRDITPQQTATLLNVIRQDAERDEARAERAANEAERDQAKADEEAAQGITAQLMGPVYSGKRSPAEALRLFSEQAPGIDPKVRRAILGAITSEANGIEEVRRNNPAFTSATDALDDGEAEMLALVRGPYRDPKTGRITTPEQQRQIISLEIAKAKRALMRQAIDKGDLGNLRQELVAGIKTRVRRYLTTRPARPR